MTSFLVLFFLSPGGESDSRPFSYQENVLPLNYPGNVFHCTKKYACVVLLTFFPFEDTVLGI